MSCPARSRGGKAGQSTRTASPPSSFSPSPASAAPAASAVASPSGSSTGAAGLASPGVCAATCASSPMLAGNVGPGSRGMPQSRATWRAGCGPPPAPYRDRPQCAEDPKRRASQRGGAAVRGKLTLSRRTGHSGCVRRPNVAASATYQSAERVLALLTSFDDSRPELGVTEMAALIGVHRLGALALRGFDLVAALQPAMDRLAAETGETGNLAVPDGPAILNVAEVPSAYILSSSGGWIGRRTTPHAVANGKVLMAYGAIAVPPDLERYTDRTITAPDLLAAELAAVR